MIILAFMHLRVYAKYANNYKNMDDDPDLFIIMHKKLFPVS